MNRYFVLGSLISLAFLSGCAAKSRAPRDVEKALFAPANVVFMGDSITQYWGRGQQGDSDAFTVNPTWTNVGVYGESSGQMLSRFQRDVLAPSPAMVHILAGTNDVYPGWVLCGGTADVDTCDNLKAMVTMARASGIQVILGTIPPWGPGDAARVFDPSPDRYSRIDQLNQWIVQYARQNSLTVVDYHALLVSPDGKTYIPAWTVDGIHPSSAGYAVMTPAAFQAIRDAQRK